MKLFPKGEWLRRLILVAFCISVAQTAAAQDRCSLSQPVLHQAGFFMSGAKINILKSARPLSKNRGLSQEQMMDRVSNHVRNYHQGLGNLTIQELSEIISASAMATGVDFAVLSSIVRKESIYCKDRYNNTGGDSGCMQFTSPALNELKHQFGLAGARNHSAGVPEVLNEMVDKYFEKDPERKDVFKTWLRQDTDTQRSWLRNRDYHDIDIFAGALLLKVYLAVNNGNYREALKQYNGSSRKSAYASDVNAVATRVSFDTFACQEDEDFFLEVYETSCEVSGDEDCFMQEPEMQVPLAPINHA